MSVYRIIPIVIQLIFLQWLTGCSSISYYSQSIQGQLEIMRKRTAIDTLLAAQNLSPDTLAQLAAIHQIRDFASSELDLPENNSYREYADIGREYVVWNVFATPALSLENQQWCFLFIGCLSYRGYFSKDAAYSLAAELAGAGYDVFVGGVTAYSTLGWFDDPVLNTMLRRDRIYLARIIFHELAHQKLYVKDDTEFNEAFADTVADAGVRKWLARYGTGTELQKYDSTRSNEDTFVNLVLQYRTRLDTVYKSSLTDAEKRRRKHELLDEMSTAYKQIRANRNEDDGYDAWFADDLNNAKLMSVAIYRTYLPGFEKLLSSSGGNLIVFYGLAEQLRGCTKEQRRYILLSGRMPFTC